MPCNRTTEGRPAPEAKLPVVVVTASMSAVELTAYCHEKRSVPGAGAALERSLASGRWRSEGPGYEPALLRESCWHGRPVSHSHNGAPMTSYTLRDRLADLSMLLPHRWLRVSNDNPYSESLFRTVKYCPEWPSKGFASLTAERDWMLVFEDAYSERHLHSGIRFVMPADLYPSTLENCRKLSAINWLLKCGHLDNRVENRRSPGGTGRSRQPSGLPSGAASEGCQKILF